MRLLLFTILILSKPGYGQEANEIVNNYLKIVSNGNIENWSKVKSIYKESEAYYSQSDFDQKINLIKSDKPSFHKSFVVLPNLHKNEIYADSSFSKLTSTFYFLKDRTIILLNNIPPIIKEPPPKDEIQSVNLPVQISKLLEKSKSVELTGVKNFAADGVSCYEIRIISKGRIYTLYINTKTFLLEYWNGRGDEDISILTKFSNYKEVDGLLIPMSESLMKNGNIFFWEHIRKYLINVDIDEEVFLYKEN